MELLLAYLFVGLFWPRKAVTLFGNVGACPFSPAPLHLYLSVTMKGWLHYWLMGKSECVWVQSAGNSTNSEWSAKILIVTLNPSEVCGWQIMIMNSAHFQGKYVRDCPKRALVELGVWETCTYVKEKKNIKNILAGIRGRRWGRFERNIRVFF